MTRDQALLKCIAALKLIDRADCKDDSVWNAIADAQAEAERVMRENPESEIWHVQQLRAAASYPMWNGHAEVSKSLLTGAANIIEAAAARISKLKAEAVLRDGEKQEPVGYVRRDSLDLVSVSGRKILDLPHGAPLFAAPASATPAVVEVPEGVLKAAIAWWEACRPMGWSEASHIAHPAVNTLTSVGNALGKAVAAYLAAPQPAAAPSGYVLVPLKPTHAQIKAMAESRAVDDEGEYPLMLDLLGFSGENKTDTVLAAAYVAAITANKD